MKIAYLFNQYPSLTETFLAREVAALRKRGLDIEIFALEAGEGATKIEKAHLIFRANEKNFWWETGKKLGKQLKNQGFMHIHAAWSNHIALLAWSAAKTTGLPWSFAAHAHDLWVESGGLDLKIHAAQNVFCCSTQGVEKLQKHAMSSVDAAKIIYAPHGIELEQWPFHEWKNSSEIRLLGVGRLIEKKGWPLLIATVAQITKDGRNVHLRIVGEGHQRSFLESRIKQLELINVELMGALPLKSVKEQMLWANCFVLPSEIASGSLDRDGLPNVLIEAAASGLPLITTNAGSAGDLVDDETGILLPHTSQHQVSRTVEAIYSVFKEPQKTKNRSLAARRRVEERFDVERNVEVMARSFSE